MPSRNRRRLAPAIFALTGLLLATFVLVEGERGAPRVAAQTGASSVTYHAGWNLVSVPTGTELTGASGPAYALGPGDTGYVPLGQGELVGGRAAWVYFPQDTTIALGRSAAEFSRVIAPAGSYLLAGNPSASEAVSVSGADLALTYDPEVGYRQVSELQPGQGAFLVSLAGGDILLGKAPSGGLADQVRQLQQAITENPTDRANIDRLGTVAAELVQARQYDQVQAAMDDLRAAAEDGLRRAGSGLLPALSQVQIGSEVTIREALARARAAAAAGNLSQADAEIAAAQQAAQAAEADGVALARSGQEMRYLAVRPGQAAAQNLAGFGALLRSSIFATSLGQPPQNDFWSLASTVLASPPIVVQPPTSVAPAAPASSASATATATPAGSDCSQGCSFGGDGSYTVAVAQGVYTVTGTFSLRLSVSGGQVSGQGTYQAQGVFNIPDAECGPVPYSGNLTVSGSLGGQTLHLDFAASGTQQINVSCAGIPVPVSTQGAGFPPASFFKTMDIQAADGASGSASDSGQIQDVTGSIKLTLHKTP